MRSTFGGKSGNGSGNAGSVPRRRPPWPLELGGEPARVENTGKAASGGVHVATKGGLTRVRGVGFRLGAIWVRSGVNVEKWWSIGMRLGQKWKKGDPCGLCGAELG